MIWLEGFFGVGRCKTVVADLPCFWAQWLSKKNILLWRDLWDCSSRSWKDWCALAPEYALSLADRPIIMDIVNVIAQEILFKMNIDMLGPFWQDWSSLGQVRFP